jgi:hypothetical protein
MEETALTVEPEDLEETAAQVHRILSAAEMEVMEVMPMVPAPKALQVLVVAVVNA